MKLLNMYNFSVYGALREYTRNQTSHINLLFLCVLLTILLCQRFAETFQALIFTNQILLCTDFRHVTQVFFPTLHSAYQRSAPGRECPPGPASPGPGRDWIPGLNSMNPGAGRDPGT